MIKKQNLIFAILIIFFISCNTRPQESDHHQTHTHDDGTVHSHSDDNGHDPVPKGQESFEIQEEDTAVIKEHDHSHELNHEHNHPHTH